MYGLKVLLGSAALVAGMALGPAAHAQISIGINIGGPPPVCQYGYYDYAPYACAPYGYYGPGYFYNGIFLGVGPWAGWGYAHGWGSHRFVAAGGGRYNGRGGYEANHGHFVHGYDDRAHGAPHSSGHPSAAHSSGHSSMARSSGHSSSMAHSSGHPSTEHSSGHPSSAHSNGHSSASHGGQSPHGGSGHDHQ